MTKKEIKKLGQKKKKKKLKLTRGEIIKIGISKVQEPDLDFYFFKRTS
jgi:hypothetical protein